MKKREILKFMALIVAVGMPFIIAPEVFAQAASGNVSQVQDFIKNIIKVLASLAGLVATGFFVVGGFGYITSSGNPEKLDKSKQTLIWSGAGLAIVIAAFVISNIITEIASNSFGK